MHTTVCSYYSIPVLPERGLTSAKYGVYVCVCYSTPNDRASWRMCWVSLPCTASWRAGGANRVLLRTCIYNTMPEPMIEQSEHRSQCLNYYRHAADAGDGLCTDPFLHCPYICGMHFVHAKPTLASGLERHRRSTCIFWTRYDSGGSKQFTSTSSTGCFVEGAPSREPSIPCIIVPNQMIAMCRCAWWTFK